MGVSPMRCRAILALLPCYKLCRAGLDRERVATSAYNGHGPWWNAGASQMNHALPTRTLGREGLISLIEEHRHLASV